LVKLDKFEFDRVESSQLFQVYRYGDSGHIMTPTQHSDRKRLNTLMNKTFSELRSNVYDGSFLTEMNQQQVRTLFLLSLQETTNMSEVSSRLGVGLPTATNLVRKLEEKGLVIREHDTTDRRVVCCSVTERGKAEIELLWILRKEQIAKLVESISGENVKLVTQAMEIILEALNRDKKDIETKSRESLSGGSKQPKASSK
jgi:DNA-binding MarR family transcriptional regulator